MGYIRNMPYIRRLLIRISAVSLLLPVLMLVSCRNSLSLYLPILNDIDPLTGEPPKNVILIIGDGMGEEHIKAGGMAGSGAGTLVFEDTAVFPVTTLMGTRNAWGGVTDSAASATAMATGSKVSNAVLSLDIPGSGSSLQTLAEMARGNGKAIGLVTTDNILSATPSAFVVHQSSRNNYPEIAIDMLDFKPNILFGGGLALSVEDAEADYIVIETESDFSGLTYDSSEPVFVYGRFGDDILPYEMDGRGSLPSLDAMTDKALDLLEEDPEGFFLVIENELTDEASHHNTHPDTVERLVEEVAALENAVNSVLSWIESKDPGGDHDTLVIVAADHETGGLTILQDNGVGELPTVSWSTTGHTSKKVRIFARGPDSQNFASVLENMDIFRLISRYY